MVRVDLLQHLVEKAHHKTMPWNATAVAPLDPADVAADGLVRITEEQEHVQALIDPDQDVPD